MQPVFLRLTGPGSLPTGGQIRVQVSTAGNQLKLQFLSQSTYLNNPFKSLGQLLMFQPETGSLSLNLDVTKNLFQALGGKLIVRQKPKQGEPRKVAYVDVELVKGSVIDLDCLEAD